MAKLNHPLCYIVVTGGVLSGLGKGVSAAAIGKLLRLAELSVVPIKCEGYLNIDPGTMNPIEHGEVFVLDDGEEADMDFGHYERMLDVRCRADWNITMGKIYSSIFEKERKGDYLGKTVQMIPHVTDQIKQQWLSIAEKTQAHVVLIEVGGTVGDLETEMFIEAARQMRNDDRFTKVLYVHLTYVPTLDVVGEPKTKPTQQTVSHLRQRGITPDIILARASQKLDASVKKKISLFCDVQPEAVISAPDVPTIYSLPLVYAEEGILNILRREIPLPKSISAQKWKKLVERIKSPDGEITVGICGKYTSLEDSYASINFALTHAGAHNNVRVIPKYIDVESITAKNASSKLSGVDAVIVPGGFGNRGAEGKMHVIKHVRENNIPFLGICLGMQLAAVEYARNVCGLEGAHSNEFDPACDHPIVALLDEQREVTQKGGTMRTGGYAAQLKKGSVVEKLYRTSVVRERHRHRYEINPAYHSPLEKAGMSICGKLEGGNLAEFLEIPSHKFFVATQAHPELTSNLERPAPLFLGLVGAALKKK